MWKEKPNRKDKGLAKTAIYKLREQRFFVVLKNLNVCILNIISLYTILCIV